MKKHSCVDKLVEKLLLDCHSQSVKGPPHERDFLQYFWVCFVCLSMFTCFHQRIERRLCELFKTVGRIDCVSIVRQQSFIEGRSGVKLSALLAELALLT